MTQHFSISAFDFAPPPMPAAPPLTALEAEVIHLFVELGRLLGQPRSYAEIYGLLFISARPLAMDHLIERLRLSKGSASQRLKFLRNAGAIRPVYVAGDRRVHYEAVAELRNLATRFLRDQVLPRLDAGLDRMDRIAELVRKMPPEDRGRVQARVTMLHSWGRQSRRVIPFVTRLLGGWKGRG